MNRFQLNSFELDALKEYDTIASGVKGKTAYSYCQGCADSGCTGSAQYGCKSCSSCADWQKGHGA